MNCLRGVDFRQMPSDGVRRVPSAEVARPFRGTPEERIQAALKAATVEIELFRADLPPGSSEEVVRRLIRRKKQAGRSPSGCLDEP